MKHHKSAAYVANLELRFQLWNKVREAHECVHNEHRNYLIKDFQPICWHTTLERLYMANHNHLCDDEKNHRHDLNNQVVIVDY